MRTFELTIATTATVTVPEQFLTQLREDAKQEDTTAFLKEMQKLHADDDDEFILAVLQNGIRLDIRDSLIKLINGSGLGLRLAPAQVKGTPKPPPPEDAQPLLLVDALKDAEPVIEDTTVVNP